MTTIKQFLLATAAITCFGIAHACADELVQTQRPSQDAINKALNDAYEHRKTNENAQQKNRPQPPQQPPPNRFAIGNEITFPEDNPVYHRDYYGCFDLANTLEAETIRAEVQSKFATDQTAWRFALDAVEQYVLSHQPDFRDTTSTAAMWKNSCIALLPSTKYKVAAVQGTYWREVVCLEVAEPFDVRSPEQREKDEKEGKQKDARPICFWTKLDAAPPMHRREKR